MEHAITRQDYASKQAELDRQLNDPDMAMEPARIWALLKELAISAHKKPNYQMIMERSV